MTKFTLTLLDTSGIQDYIFSSNRLQENIGASEIVYRATSLWVFETLNKMGIKHNILNPISFDWEFSKDAIEDSTELQAEVIQAAGGNTLILFREKELSREFVRQHTLQILSEAPGLTLLAQHDDEFEFDTQQATLPKVIGMLHDKMKRYKLSRQISTRLYGLGVTAICESTGLPAVNTLGGKFKVSNEPIGLPGEDETSLISYEAIAKRRWRSAANGRLSHLLGDAADDYIFPFDLEKIGREKGEESYVAVIHADGNRMSEHVNKVRDTASNDRDFIEKLRDFSTKINNTSRSALESAVGLVVQAVKREDIPVVEDKEGKYLPFRPLVFGGDDVTFVCNGKIGVSLAAAYIDIFEKAAQNQGLDDFHACAGVSIVKMHYPFARAYKLAEELTHSAKKLVKDSGKDFSALDWHFAQSGLSGLLDVIRDREYMSEEENKRPLHIRPLTLKKNAFANVRSWEEVHRTMKKFNEETHWLESHNKIIGLRVPLRKGPKAVEQYLLNYGLGDLPEFDGAEKTGWFADRCAYFDIIELLDHHVSLEPELIKEGMK